MPNAKILIVDDEADIIQALKMRLETEGHRALTASNGLEALRLLGNTSVDVILADVMMPEIDGLELTRRVRQDPRWITTQVVLFSCNDDPAARILALEFGALDYLSKALGGREIVSRVNEVLASIGTADPDHGNRLEYEQAERDLRTQLRAISDLNSETDGAIRFAFDEERATAGVESSPDLQNLAEVLRRFSMAGDKRSTM